ncbi:putative membrane protein [Meiothermus luteus]|jgi:membrane-associated protein|uniref:Putative membrane protein n=1 Tax=Meiothermus luteus TaxID=2026184 RepID=A0A399EPS1_9DEIN|nr:DedA family protein [Meiothermus luteus]RIH86627.1 putative membrane protein [Meiothermus luteus]RMH58111.1 MAG: DedA family protein [Deinococcota bacterium]
MDVSAYVEAVGYLGIFATVFVETGLLVGFFLPGDSLLIAVGLLAAAKKMQLPLALLALLLGSVLGNNLGYYLGRRWGPPLLRRARLKPEDLERTRRFMARFGPASLLIGPYVPVFRAVVPFLCGTVRMPWPRFFVLSLLGSLLWTQGLTLLAYYVGSRIPHLERYIYLILMAGVGFAVLLAAWRAHRAGRLRWPGRSPVK